jgi:cytochrome b6-f complex iron-sulfur subunit
MNKQEMLNRNEFLKNLGLKGAALVAAYCAGNTLVACKNDSAVTPMGDTVIDLNNASYAALKNNGGYVVLSAQNIVVARTNQGQYVAVTLICSHEQRKEITYKTSEFYCTAHGARFSNAGLGLNSEGSRGLTVYKTSLSGNTLTITV